MREKTTALILLATLAGFGCDDGAVITDSGVTTGDGDDDDIPWPPPARNLTDYMFNNYLARPANMMAVSRIASGAGSLQEMYHGFKELFESALPTAHRGSAAAVDELAEAFAAGSVLDDTALPQALLVALKPSAPPIAPIVRGVVQQYLKLFLRRLVLDSFEPTDDRPTPFADMANRLVSVFLGALASKLVPHLSGGGADVDHVFDLAFLTGGAQCLPMLAPFEAAIQAGLRERYESYQALSASASAWPPVRKASLSA